MLWNWHAPALWNRFVIELVRVLAAHAGLSEQEWRQLVRVAYAKVAEFQARGLVHFPRRRAAGWRRGPRDGARRRRVAEELCDAIREAAGRARLDGDAGDDETVELRFGEQLHTRVLASVDEGAELSAGKVAAYVAKYSCGATRRRSGDRAAGFG